MKEKNKKYSGQKSVFVVFEGISACGKSEYIRIAIKMLNATERSYYLYEWNDNRFFRFCTDFLERNGKLTATLFSIIQYLSFLYDVWFKLIPASKKYDYVLCDRYIYTAVVRDKCNNSKLVPFNNKMDQFFIPDFIFYVKAEPDICYNRMLKRGKKLRYFGDKKYSYEPILAYLERSEEEYNKLFNILGLKVITVDNTNNLCLDKLLAILTKVGIYE